MKKILFALLLISSQAFAADDNTPAPPPPPIPLPPLETATMPANASPPAVELPAPTAPHSSTPVTAPAAAPVAPAPEPVAAPSSAPSSAPTPVQAPVAAPAPAAAPAAAPAPLTTSPEAPAEATSETPAAADTPAISTPGIKAAKAAKAKEQKKLVTAAQLISQQIKSCWKIPKTSLGKKALNALIYIDQNGNLTFDSFIQEPNADQTELAESIKQAVASCTPLKKLPPQDSYSDWRNIIIKFNPNRKK